MWPESDRLGLRESQMPLGVLGAIGVAGLGVSGAVGVVGLGVSGPVGVSNSALLEGGLSPGRKLAGLINLEKAVGWNSSVAATASISSGTAKTSPAAAA